jgi:putative DNA-invertase from lambdoid prophage Rac
MERKEFKRLMDRLEWDDVLVVTKLDRLGRNAMDVKVTVENFASERCGCTALPWAAST